MRILNNYLPKNLENTLKRDDYIKEGFLAISALQYYANDLTVGFKIYLGENADLLEHWEIFITNISKESFARSIVNSIFVYDDHYLLYDFNDDLGELYFNGKSTNNEKLFIDLYDSYLKNYYGQHIPFGYGFNPIMNITKPCNSNSGLFASGPQNILKKYQEILIKNNINCNLLTVEKRSNKDLKIMFFGESYFIGDNFDFKRIS